MSNQYVQIAPDSTGKKVQVFENTVGIDTVESQGVALVDPTNGAAIAVATSAPVGTEEALVTRNIPSGLQNVALNDLLAGLSFAISSLQRPMWLDYGQSALRINVVAGTLPTVTTVGTVSTVTTVTNVAGYSAKDTMLNSLDRTSYYQGPRQRIV